MVTIALFLSVAVLLLDLACILTMTLRILLAFK
eukprot:CAMPEP_0114170304 /NCGR_PEP_ID=MMETSP0043_2-20121206/34064_1 /TAXON_ID=464988 /ORGANISM="Hemiselmis andersenii, Strain CCMP644" /LENGTH=32 /DNA_ID= /DNA_START= /DNA_END= /DNA_ORIENTATION=